MTSQEPVKITVVTAVYNAEATVGDAISSVARQTYPYVEHLVVEGKSNDGSLFAIDAAQHPRMRLISEPDLGIYDALNKGVANASGDVIGFVHADDFLSHDDVLVHIARQFEDPDVDAVYGDLDYVARHDTSRVVRHWSAGTFRPWRLRLGWMPPHPTLYLRSDVYRHLDGFDTRLEIAADYDFMLRHLTSSNGRAAYIPEVLYKMRMGGVSNRDWRRIRIKMREDLRAIRRNRVGGIHTLALKNLSKVGQLLVR